MNRLKQFGLLAVIVVGALIGERFGLIDTGLLDRLIGPSSTGPIAGSPSSSQQTPRSAPAISGVCADHALQDHPQAEALVQLGRSEGLRYPVAFANTSISLYETGRLPECYRTKNQARQAGWSPGSSVWVAGKGIAIGGDRFGNREGRLPSQYNGRYREADLGYDGNRGRNAKRLVYVENARGQWQQWLTVDHYDSFTRVQP